MGGVKSFAYLNRRQLLKMGMAEVNKTYKFARGKSESGKKGKAVSSKVESRQARWSRTAREERMQKLEEEIDGIKKDMQIAERNCNIKFSFNKYEEAESLRE